ncbi:hypothetical protein CAC42_807 [Sphaceloma murrayae]|uniref:RNase MRP protein 1 RNA binding domain-containing protein n=1 Tax=Sphaceloma murrayae TaxID=2082308 RepID=A0A2K1QK66_9PEZI|nr:hypothetical protein CAC42_807 [Sphaceloma murrayae]
MSPLKVRLSPSDLATLTHLSTLLHLAHHRNKNQHRRAHWYRSLSLLRRHLSVLVNLYTTLNAVPDTHSARHRKKAADRTTTEKVERELVYFSDVLVPRSWRAFSQLVAEGRFAVLGVALMAVLGEVARVTGVTAWVEEEGQREVEDVLERFAGEVDGLLGGRDGTAGKGKGEGQGGDLGVVVARTGEDLEEGRGVVQRAAVDGLDEEEVVQSLATAELASERHEIRGMDEGDGTKVKKRKKRKGGDAIDDLFAGL